MPNAEIRRRGTILRGSLVALAIVVAAVVGMMTAGIETSAELTGGTTAIRSVPRDFAEIEDFAAMRIPYPALAPVSPEGFSEADNVST